jgi:hypothetical protein
MLDGIKTNYQNFKDNKNNFKLIFNTNSNNKYRFDLQLEQNTNIYHLMFSEEKFEKGEYEKLTNKNEAIEVFSRLYYILTDFSKNLNNVEFCCLYIKNVQENNLFFEII